MAKKEIYQVSASTYESMEDYKDDDLYAEEMQFVADCFNTALWYARQEHGNRDDRLSTIGDVGKLLLVISRYKDIIDMFHEETNKP